MKSRVSTRERMWAQCDVHTTSHDKNSYFILEHGETYSAFFIDSRVINLRLEFHLTSARRSFNTASTSVTLERGTYIGGFEWELLIKLHSEDKLAVLIRTIELINTQVRSGSFMYCTVSSMMGKSSYLPLDRNGPEEHIALIDNKCKVLCSSNRCRQSIYGHINGRMKAGVDRHRPR